MKNYRMEWQSWAGGVPWMYDFNMASDKMAIDYAERTAVTSNGFRAEGLALLLWDLESQTLLGRFVLDKPTVRNTEPVKESA